MYGGGAEFTTTNTLYPLSHYLGVCSGRTDELSHLFSGITYFVSL